MADYGLCVGYDVDVSTEVDRQSMGDRMRRRREAMGLSQQEVAEAMHTKRINYAQYELGRNAIPSLDLPRLARVLRCPIGYFFGEDEGVVAPEALETPPRIADLVAEFVAGLPSDVQARVFRAILRDAMDREAREEKEWSDRSRALLATFSELTGHEVDVLEDTALLTRRWRSLDRAAPSEKEKRRRDLGPVDQNLQHEGE